jgi:hypothetical protein
MNETVADGNEYPFVRPHAVGLRKFPGNYAGNFWIAETIGFLQASLVR